jgi:aconitate hydratase
MNSTVDLPRFAAAAGFALADVPFLGRVLIEALVRAGDTPRATLLGTRLAGGEEPDLEMPFRPARILMQDYTGIPLLVDLAALRGCVAEPGRVNPTLPVDVVVDHSVQTDWARRPDALALNEARELERNAERYAFLKWAASAFTGVRVIPPGQGIVHQINLERLATVVARDVDGRPVPDTVIGTDSHTSMVSGLGVLGWGVGGLEAEALILGLAQPIRIPAVVGVRLVGAPGPGVSATDVVLALTQRLRAENVRGLLVEFTGSGVAALSAPDRCTIANMAPEYGAMTGFFPVDEQTLDYLRRTGRPELHVRFVEDYCRDQGLWRTDREPRFSRLVEIDLSAVRPGLAGPSRPDEWLGLDELSTSFARLHGGPIRHAGGVADGDLVIAAITSCTSTSNPRAMIAAGLLARNAVVRGLRVPTHVKTSLAPGSRIVTDYLTRTGLLSDLATLGFHVVGYGCMTCNGGSGELTEGVGDAVDRAGLTVAAVLSGNRNFAGRVHPQVRAGYLAAPALVVALALAGHVRLDPWRDPLGIGADGRPVHLRDIWPDPTEVDALEVSCLEPGMFGGPPESPAWTAVAPPGGPLFDFSADSTYIRPPAYVDAPPRPWPVEDARVLVALGDDVSTDHISPVGAIAPASPAGRYLRERGVREFNSYGSRRGNHEVMARGTFANRRMGNRLLGDGDSGGDTLHLPSGERVPVFEAAARYARVGTPLIVLAGRNYGMGSSRDWAAKGPWLLGVRAVLAESFERIHRANLCAVGILPLRLPAGRSWAALGLTGTEEFRIVLDEARRTGRVGVTAGDVRFVAQAAVHSAGEWEVLLAGGTLAYLRQRLEQAVAR